MLIHMNDKFLERIQYVLALKIHHSNFCQEKISIQVYSNHDVRISCLANFCPLGSNIRHVRHEVIQFSIRLKMAAQIGIDSH